jgi:hypothetical protein
MLNLSTFTMPLISAIVFGIMIGYLSWKAIHAHQQITFERIGALVGVVGGAAVLRMFSESSDTFAAYVISTCFSFVVCELFWGLTFGRREKKNAKLEEQLNGQWERIKADWPDIERFIRSRLNQPYKYSLTFLDCSEIDVHPVVMEYALKHYAILHAEDEDVAFVKYRSIYDKPSGYWYNPHLTGRLVKDEVILPTIPSLRRH